MNPNEMSLDQCRDWLSADMNWSAHALESGTGGRVSMWKRGEEEWFRHPIAPTLDAIAACMPEGWDWTREYVAIGGDPSEIKWLACSSHLAGIIGIPDTGDEKLDRARLAVACRMAVKEKE